MMANTDFSLTYSAKDVFFDRQAVVDAIGKAEAKQLSRIGAFIRRTAQRKVLRFRKRTSVPVKHQACIAGTVYGRLGTFCSLMKVSSTP